MHALCATGVFTGKMRALLHNPNCALHFPKNPTSGPNRLHGLSHGMKLRIGNQMVWTGVGLRRILHLRAWPDQASMQVFRRILPLHSTHGRQKARCKDCGRSSFCEYGRQRSRCKDTHWCFFGIGEIMSYATPPLSRFRCYSSRFSLEFTAHAYIITISSVYLFIGSFFGGDRELEIYDSMAFIRPHTLHTTHHKEI
jgi:hypothetical protein